MTTKAITVQRRQTIASYETIEVTFPLHNRGSTYGYAGHVPYENAETLTRIEADGKVTSVTRTWEEGGDRKEPTLSWEITTELVKERNLGDHLPDKNDDATADHFRLHLIAARAWMGI